MSNNKRTDALDNMLKAAYPKDFSDTYPANFMAAYNQLCTSYHAIDEFRTTLLGLLPLATGAGTFLLLNNLQDEQFKTALLPIGAFGFLITLGLFFYELHGIKKCGHLIDAGKKMEIHMGIYGQFQSRPHEVAGFIDEPFTACVIYPAVLSTWAFLALLFIWPPAALLAAIVVFIVGFVVSLRLNRAMEADLSHGKTYDKERYIPKLFGKDWRESTAADPTGELTALNERILQAEEKGLKDELAPLLADGFTIIRSSGVKQGRQKFLDEVSSNSNLGRFAEPPEVRIYGECAVVTVRVTTLRKPDGTVITRNFWNTRMFLREGIDWLCIAWQVTEITNS